MAEAVGVAAKPVRREQIRVGGMDRSVRVLALFVFLLGVGLLVGVFFWTKGLFDSLAQANQEWLKKPGQPGAESGWADYFPAFGAQLIRVGLLFVLGYLASSIATKGAQLLAATFSSNAESSGARDVANLP